MGKKQKTPTSPGFTGKFYQTLEQEMEIPWTKEPGGLQSTGSQRVRLNWETKQQYTNFSSRKKHFQIHFTSSALLLYQTHTYIKIFKLQINISYEHTCKKILNNALSNQFQQYLKKIKQHDQVGFLPQNARWFQKSTSIIHIINK